MLYKISLKFILIFFILLEAHTICGADEEAQRIEQGTLIIETGRSTESILPLLKHTASFAGKYFSYMYGQCRNQYIIIRFNRNVRNISLVEIDRLVIGLARNINTFHPSSKGELEILASDIDSWNSLQVEFENGIITNKKFNPSHDILLEKIHNNSK